MGWDTNSKEDRALALARDKAEALHKKRCAIEEDMFSAKPTKTMKDWQAAQEAWMQAVYAEGEAIEALWQARFGNKNKKDG